MNSRDENSNHVKISTERLEGFSDAVMAIIITISVLTVKIPAGSGFDSLNFLLPTFLVYAVSFQTIGTYWNNHHHLLLAVKHVSAGIMWANLYLLFWMSLIPVATAWLGQHYASHWPTALYVFVLLMSAMAYTLLQLLVIKHSEKPEELFKEFFKKPKASISLAMYLVALAFAFYVPLVSDVLIILVAMVWFIPDRRIEKYI